MGCNTYTVLNFHGDERRIKFSEMDDTIGCLCTFPHNNQKGLDAEDVRSLAYLGAAVVLAIQGDAEDYQFLPDSLPEWVRKGIDKYLLWDKPDPTVVAPKYDIVSEGWLPAGMPGVLELVANVFHRKRKQ